MIPRKKLVELMKVAIGEAEKACTAGNWPFASLLVDKNGLLIAIGRNSQNSEDRVAHAEISMIRLATKQLHTSKLSGFEVISTSEPCSMCVSALIKAGIDTIYYGAPLDKGNNPFIRAVEIASRSNFPVTVIGGILEKECKEQVRKVRLQQF